MSNNKNIITPQKILTGTLQALFVDSPDEVPAIIAPGRRLELYQHEIVTFSRLFLTAKHKPVHVIQLDILNRLIIIGRQPFLDNDAIPVARAPTVSIRTTTSPIIRRMRHTTFVLLVVSVTATRSRARFLLFASAKTEQHWKSHTLYEVTAVFDITPNIAHHSTSSRAATRRFITIGNVIWGIDCFATIS